MGGNSIPDLAIQHSYHGVTRRRPPNLWHRAGKAEIILTTARRPDGVAFYAPLMNGERAAANFPEKDRLEIVLANYYRERDLRELDLVLRNHLHFQAFGTRLHVGNRVEFSTKIDVHLAQFRQTDYGIQLERVRIDFY